MSNATSAVLRNKGNALLRSAENVGPCLKRARLNQARDLYLEAAHCSAAHSDEHVSAIKNAAIASKRLRDASSTTEEQLDNLLAAVGLYDSALSLGWSIKDGAWLDGCFSSAMALFGELVSMVAVEDDVDFIMGTLHRCYTALLHSSTLLKSTWCLQHAQYLFNRYVQDSQQYLSTGRPVQREDYLLWGRLIQEAMRPAQETLQGAATAEPPPSEEVLSDARVLLQDLRMAASSLESVKMREQADAALEHEMFSELTPRMDVVWGVVDSYREAAKLTREMDLENEAVALSRLGRVYDKVIKDTARASACFNEVLRLGEALKPRMVFNLPWYQEAMEAVRRYQEAAVQKDQQAADQRRAPFLEALATELAALKAASSKGSAAYLRYIYATHPPRNPAHELDEDPVADNTKVLLRRAVGHYHPDKQHGSEESWGVLCEEITKYLNHFYETFK